MFGFGVSTENDSGLFTLRTAISRIYDDMEPERTLDVYNGDTAELIGHMVLLYNTTVQPMSKAETRPFQFVEAIANLDPFLTRS